MVWDRWQAPDRDSPTTVRFDFNVELGEQLKLLLQMDGHVGTSDEEVASVTGTALSRPRRWHKLFERMGLVYQDGSGLTHLTDLGQSVRLAQETGGRDVRRALAKAAISVLRKYQLQNPADTSGEDSYPPDTDLHPYWAVWKAAIELGGKLHWDELNRVLMWVLRHSDLPAAIARIRAARQQSGYDPVNNGTAAVPLGDRAYDQTTAPAGKDPAGQVRDQKTTPWFKRAGLGELLLQSPGHGGEGYWTVHPDVVDLLDAEVKAAPPPFRPFADVQQWFEYFGRVDADAYSATPGSSQKLEKLAKDLPDSDEIWVRVAELIKAGSVGIILSGPPGTSKTWYAHRIGAKLVDGKGDRIRFVQFHPSYNYEDFVEGLVPGEGSGQPAFKPAFKIFMKLCEAARINPTELHVLVIDELNRGDPSRIFGELLTYLERDYRDQQFTLPYSGVPAMIPHNVLIIATMNPYDKSVADLDDAFERRFDRIAVNPNIDTLRDMLTRAGFAGAEIGKVIEFFKLVNARAPHGFGHAFFAKADSVEALRSLWNHKLRFVLEKAFRFEPDVYKEIRDAYVAIFAEPTNLS